MLRIGNLTALVACINLALSIVLELAICLRIIISLDLMFSTIVPSSSELIRINCMTTNYYFLLVTAFLAIVSPSCELI